MLLYILYNSFRRAHGSDFTFGMTLLFFPLSFVNVLSKFFCKAFWRHSFILYCCNQVACLSLTISAEINTHKTREIFLHIPNNIFDFNLWQKWEDSRNFGTFMLYCVKNLIFCKGWNKSKSGRHFHKVLKERNNKRGNTSLKKSIITSVWQASSIITSYKTPWILGLRGLWRVFMLYNVPLQIAISLV